MVEIYGNELSITEEVFEKYENIKNLADVYKGLAEYGISSCRVSNEALNQIYGYLSSNPEKRNILSFVYSFLHSPFDTDEVVEYCAEEYVSHSWMFNNMECIGLAYAYIMDSMTISIGADGWEPIIQISKDAELIGVRNATNKEQLSNHFVWLESLKKIELVETAVLPSVKVIKLRDDHGKDLLLDFSKRICNCPYVIGIINSLPFNPRERNFIHKVRTDGVVECVLCWTDRGYGLAVQTTGRNLRETEKIADILMNKYGLG